MGRGVGKSGLATSPSTMGGFELPIAQNFPVHPCFFWAQYNDWAGDVRTRLLIFVPTVWVKIAGEFGEGGREEVRDDRGGGGGRGEGRLLFLRPCVARGTHAHTTYTPPVLLFIFLASVCRRRVNTVGERGGCLYSVVFYGVRVTLGPRQQPPWYVGGPRQEIGGEQRPRETV